MSRCFPFPPPNYRMKENTSLLNLTDSIKHNKEGESSKQRKDKKREKQEKKEKRDTRKDGGIEISRHRKDKKREGEEKNGKRDKSKDGGTGISKHREHSHKKQKLNERDALPIIKDVNPKPETKNIRLEMKDEHEKVREVEKNVVLTKDERSGITEELGLPSFTPEPCQSSESTQNSSKAGRNHETNNINQGISIIRFKFPVQKQNGQKPTVTEAPLCMVPVQKQKDRKPTVTEYLPTKLPAQNQSDQKFIVTEHPPCVSGQSAPKVLQKIPANEEPCFSGHATEKRAIEQESYRKSKRSKRHHDPERKFKKLILNGKPEPLVVGNDEDLGWLFSHSRQIKVKSDEQCVRSDTKSCGMSNGIASEDLSYRNAAYAFQPRACYLPELEMYQLPFVVPF